MHPSARRHRVAGSIAVVPSPAALVITGTRVWVGDANRSFTDAIAVRDGHVVALGADDVGELVGPRTQVLHRPGAMVVPGFQDAHVHAPPAGRTLQTVDLHDLDGQPEYLRRIAAYVAAHPAADWIVGGGWAMEYFPGGLPHRDDLDTVTGDRPTFLFNRDMHGAWVNSAALRIAGIDARTPDPADGRIERGPSGEPTGMLHEGAAYSFETRWVPTPTLEDWEQAILVAQRHLHALGITGWQDAWVTPDTLAAYTSLASSGQLTARVVGALWWDRHRGLGQIEEFLAQRQQGVGSFHPNTVKIMVDGVLENQTGALLEPYCDGCGGHTDNRGLTYVNRELLAAAVTQLDSAGFQVHMHAIGDRAVRIALDAVEAALSANGPSDNRHHIAHLQVIQPEDLRRFAPLAVIANCQTLWAQSEPQMDELTIPFLGRERAELQYPFADLRRAGARLAMGSDWAVTTADPLQQMEVAIRRVDPEHRDNAPFLPEQALTLEEALSAFTAGSAFVNHDAEGGTLQLGSRADLAVVDQDLFELDGRLAQASVVCTVAGGTIVHTS